MPSRITSEELKGLWAIGWRFLLLGPILLPIGLAILGLVIVIVLGPFCYGIYLMCSEHIIWGVVVSLAWCVVLKMSRFLFQKLLDGAEYAGI